MQINLYKLGFGIDGRFTSSRLFKLRPWQETLEFFHDATEECFHDATEECFHNATEDFFRDATEEFFHDATERKPELLFRLRSPASLCSVRKKMPSSICSAQALPILCESKEVLHHAAVVLTST